MTRLARLFAALFAIAGAALASVAITAAPAHADQGDCVNVVAQSGFPVTDGVIAGCATGEQGDYDGCFQMLLAENVIPPVADQACGAAQN